MNWLRKLMGWHIHEWGKWEVIGDLKRTGLDSVVGKVQERHCATCGQIQWHKEWLV